MKQWLCAIVVVGSVYAVEAGDWSAWRGPTANGISPETGLNISNLEERWRIECGAGHSAACVSGEHLFTMGNLDGQDVVYCVNALTGKTIWTTTYLCDGGNFSGPRATPVLDGEFLYVHSREGVLRCLKAASGEVVWTTDLLEKTGNKNLRWGVASSPVIEGDLILLNIGQAGVAVNKTSGAIVWDNGVGDFSYASVVVFTHENQRCAALFTAAGLQVVNVATGARVATYAWETKYDINGADPMIIGDRIFISSGYKHGCAMLKWSGGKLEKVWENQVLMNQFNSSIYYKGYIYGNDGHTKKKKGSLRCINAANGKEVWSKPMGLASLMMADGNLFVITEKDQLMVIKADPSACTVLSEQSTGLGKLCWAAPVLSNGMLYCRNTDGTMVALDVR